MTEPLPIEGQMLEGMCSYLSSGRFVGILQPEDLIAASDTISNIMGNGDITDKLKNMGRLMLVAGYLHGKHIGVADEAKVQYENIFAEACDIIRKEMAAGGATKITNVEVESKAAKNEGCKAAKDRFTRASELRAIMEAFRDGVRSAQFSLQAVLKHEDAVVSDGTE